LLISWGVQVHPLHIPWLRLWLG